MVLIVEQIFLISNKTLQKTGEYTCWHVYLSALLRPWCIHGAIVRSIHPGRGLRFCCNYRKDEVNKFFIIWHLIVVDQSLRSIKTNNWSADNLKKNMSTQWVLHSSPQYTQVTLVSGYTFWQLPIDHNINVHKDVH